MLSPDDSDLILGERCPTMALATRATVTLDFVEHVVGVSAPSKVLRVDAERVVAGVKCLIAGSHRTWQAT